MIQDVTKCLISSNSSQPQDKQNLFKQSNLKTLHIDILLSHNWIHDNSIILIPHIPKLIHEISISKVYLMWHKINETMQYMQ